MSATSVKNKNTYKSFKQEKKTGWKTFRQTELNLPYLGACFLLSVAGSRRMAWDFSLACLTLALTAASEDIVEKAVFSAGGVVAFMALSAGNSAYIPYLLGQIIYIAVFSVVKNEKYPLIAAVVFTAVSKILLVNNGIGGSGAVYTLLEGVAVYALVQAVKNGREIYKNGSLNLDFTDIACLLLWGLAVVFALSGFDSRLLYTGGSLALAFSWLWIAKGENLYGILNLICFFVALRDKQGFEALFVGGCAVWIFGAVLREKNSYIIYPVAIFTAFAANLIFLAEINGFALTGTVIRGLVIYTLLPYILDFRQVKAPRTFSREKDYRQLQLNMRKLEESLNFLGSCAIDISKLNEKNMTRQSVEDMVAEEICRKCHKNSYCWQEKYSFTSQQFARYSRSMNFADKQGFDTSFYTQCNQVEKIKTSFEENSRLALSRRYILQSSKNNQKLLQTAFMSVSAAVGEMLHHSSVSRMVNSTFTMALDRFLGDLGISHSYCLRSRNPDRADFSTPEPVGEGDLYKIRSKLESLYAVKFDNRTYGSSGGEILYSFTAMPLLSFEYSVESSPLRQVNGDNFAVVENGGFVFVLLSDGMGTGAAAAAESKTVLAMAESLLGRGVSPGRMMNIVNLALNLRSGGENGASLDVLQVDLFTGKATLLKAGAGVSLVFNRKNFSRHYKDSLPLGVLKEVKFSTEEFTLAAGDTVVMISDGVGDVPATIGNLYDKPCRSVAKFAVDSNRVRDDKLALALRLKENSRRK